MVAMTREPGFREEPSLLQALEQALHVVEADVRATGLDGPVGLILNDRDEYAHAVYQGGGSGSTTGIHPADASDPVYVMVAEDVDMRNSIMHIHWGT